METLVSDKPSIKDSRAVSYTQRQADIDRAKQAEQTAQERAKHSPFNSFYQVNKHNNKYLINCLKDCPKALEIFLFLCEHMDKYNALVISYQALMEALGISRPTVARSIKYLKEHGYLYVYKSGTSNVYTLNPSLVWNSYGYNLEYAQFPANVYLSAAEQTDYASKIKDVRTPQVQLIDK